MQYDQTQESLRAQYLEEARESVRQVENQPDVLAAILTGSAAWGKPNPDGDLDILLISRNRNGVLYQYLIPAFCSVRRRTELGYIPVSAVNKNINDGYKTSISCNMIEQLKNGRVLFQKDGHGDKLIESCREVVPSRLEVGKLIGDIGKALKESEEHLEQGRLQDATLTLRRVAGLSVRALLLAREKTGIAKEKHEYRAVRKHMSEGEAASYEKLTGVGGATAPEARATTAKTIDLMKWVLQEHSLSPDLVKYNG
jgi:hypothetical protein